jgi:GDP-mannose transporter
MEKGPVLLSPGRGKLMGSKGIVKGPEQRVVCCTASVTVIKAVLLYSLCSSTLLVANKLTTDGNKNTAFIMLVQLAASVLFVVMGNLGGAIALKDGFNLLMVKYYSVYCLTFVGGIYANMRALRVTDTETVVVFRCCTPLVVATLGTLLLREKFPSPRSLLALCGIIVGAVLFVATNAESHVRDATTYMWPAIYTVVISFNMLYGKFVMKKMVALKSPVWGAVLYSNGLALPLVALLGVTTGDLTPSALRALTWSVPSLASLTVSSILGVAIAYAGFNCRNVLSATSFTLVGVMNKLVSVLLSMVIYQKASLPGIVSILICILSGTAYK